MEPLEVMVALGTSVFVIIGTVLGVVIPFFRQISRTIEKSEARQIQALKQSEARQMQALNKSEARQMQALNESEARQIQALNESEARQMQALKQTETRLTAAIEKNESDIRALNSKLMQIDRRLYTLNGLVQRLVGHTFGMEEVVEQEEGHAPVPS